MGGFRWSSSSPSCGGAAARRHSAPRLTCRTSRTGCVLCAGWKPQHSGEMHLQPQSPGFTPHLTPAPAPVCRRHTKAPAAIGRSLRGAAHAFITTFQKAATVAARAVQLALCCCCCFCLAGRRSQLLVDSLVAPEQCSRRARLRMCWLLSHAPGDHPSHLAIPCCKTKARAVPCGVGAAAKVAAAGGSGRRPVVAHGRR